MCRFGGWERGAFPVICLQKSSQPLLAWLAVNLINELIKFCLLLVHRQVSYWRKCGFCQVSVLSLTWLAVVVTV